MPAQNPSDSCGETVCNINRTNEEQCAGVDISRGHTEDETVVYDIDTDIDSDNETTISDGEKTKMSEKCISENKQDVNLSCLSEENETNKIATLTETNDNTSEYIPLESSLENNNASHNSMDYLPCNNSNEDYVPCEKCNKRLLVWDIPEHMDFHFAEELQKSIAGANPIPLGGSATLGVTSSINTGKRKSTSQVSSKVKKKSKTQDNKNTLHTFFSKK